jgi:C4-dicarboxylate-specific signal transduction histidine kinase
MHQLVSLTLLTSATIFLISPKLDPALKAEVEARVPIVEKWAADPVVLDAVREANRNPRSLEEIARIDREWQAAVGVDAFIRSVLEQPASARLRELRESNPELHEAFVTDELGANVAATNKTSDFYQGDEDKFQEAFNGRKGGLHMGKLALDESSQAYTIQIGVPVRDQGQVIGVLVVAVNVEKLKK